MENKDWREDSCITCGIKKDAIADWWIEKIESLLKSKQKEIERAMDKMKKTQDEVDDNDEGERYYNEAIDDLKPIISNILK